MRILLSQKMFHNFFFFDDFYNTKTRHKTKNRSYKTTDFFITPNQKISPFKHFDLKTRMLKVFLKPKTIVDEGSIDIIN